MVFTAAQLTHFFEHGTQMGLPHDTRLAIGREGIATMDDLAEVTEEELKLVVENLRKPPGRVRDPRAGVRGQGVAAGATISAPPLPFSARSILKLKAAAKIAQYYEIIDREMTPAMMAYRTVIKNYMLHHEILETRMKEDKTPVPKITKGILITDWAESFLDYQSRCVGRRAIPNVYVLRSLVAVPATAPDLLPDLPYSEEHGSVEGELIARASHSHPAFRGDSSDIYFDLEEATRGTQYAASLAPFKRTKDGRGGYNAIVNQFAGVDKWQAILKDCKDIMLNRMWKGQSAYPLEKFVSLHRCAFVKMEQCVNHIDYQLPNDNTRITQLLDNIECDYAPLQAAMAFIKNDTGPTGKMNDFESSVAYLLPNDPVLKKQASKDGYSVSEVTAEEGTPEVPLKNGIGKTGVHLRYHTSEEYSRLSNSQRKELRLDRGGHWKPRKELTRPDNKREHPQGDSAKLKKKVRGIISKIIAEETAVVEPDPMDDLKSYILSVVNSVPSKPDAPPANVSTLTAKSPTVASILKTRFASSVRK